MQVNRTGIALILFFGVVGAFVAVVPAALGAPAQLAMILGLLGGIWFLVAVGLALYARHQQRRAAHQDWVFRNGLKGTATVLQAGSNATVNDMPLVKLQLELRVPGSAPRQASRREVMSRRLAHPMAFEELRRHETTNAGKRHHKRNAEEDGGLQQCVSR